MPCPLPRFLSPNLSTGFPGLTRDPCLQPSNAPMDPRSGAGTPAETAMPSWAELAPRRDSAASATARPQFLARSDARMCGALIERCVAEIKEFPPATTASAPLAGGKTWAIRPAPVRQALAPARYTEGRYSSGVERSLGKGEVECSIHSSGTIFPVRPRQNSSSPHWAFRVSGLSLGLT